MNQSQRSPVLGEYTTSSVPVSLNEKGFTLVETLVAITVLLLVVIGPITVAQKGIKSAFYANEQVTAVFLAQEAIEAIREIRDTQALIVYDDRANDTWDWVAGLPDDCSDTSGCAFNPSTGNFETCTANNGCRLYLSADGEYSYTPGGSDSGFTRKVYVENDGTIGLYVRVEVVWESLTFGSGANPPVNLETWIYDHYKRYETF